MVDIVPSIKSGMKWNCYYA